MKEIIDWMLDKGYCKFEVEYNCLRLGDMEIIFLDNKIKMYDFDGSPDEDEPFNLTYNDLDFIKHTIASKFVSAEEVKNEEEAEEKYRKLRATF